MRIISPEPQILPTHKIKQAGKAKLVQLKKYKSLYIIMGVIVAYYIVFNYLPIIMGGIMSFQDFKIGNTIANAKFVGWQNYIDIFTNPDLVRLITNTVLLSIYRLLWGFWPPIILAILIFDISSARYKKVCQTIVYLPYFTSWVIIYGLVFSFFSGNGFINSLLSYLGFSKINFLMDSKYFRSLLIGSQILKNTGWGTILYFAVLTGINPELYETCKIDGAGPIRRIMVVTIPALKPIILFSLIISLGNILNNDFEQVLLFYNPAVYDVGDIIDTWVYRVGLGWMQFSLGAAVGMFKALVGFILIIGANKFSRMVSERGIW